MRIRHPVKTAFGSVLAIAIAASDVASAQSLFDSPAPKDSSSPSFSRPLAASAAPAKAKKAVAKKLRKPTVVTNASRVNIINKRAATLVELSVISMTAKDAQPQIVAHDLAPGKTISAKLAKKGGCLYLVSGTFDDQSTVDPSKQDLCKDNNLILVE